MLDCKMRLTLCFEHLQKWYLEIAIQEALRDAKQFVWSSQRGSVAIQRQGGNDDFDSVAK